MHGVVFVDPQRHVDESFGGNACRSMLGENGIGQKVCLTTQTPGERLALSEPRCMLKGSARCAIHVRPAQ